MNQPVERCTSALSALVAGPHAIFSPVAAYSTRKMGSHTLLSLTGVVVLTALAASASAPVAVHVLRTTPSITASLAVAQSFVMFQNLVLTPAGTIIVLSALSVIVWAFVLMAGADVAFNQSASIVFIAGVVHPLERLFVAFVLYARWWRLPSTLNNEVTTGLDGFVPAAITATFPFSILKHTGLFEIWFCALVAAGLEHGSGVPRRLAVLVAMSVGLTIVAIKLVLGGLFPQ